MNISMSDKIRVTRVNIDSLDPVTEPQYDQSQEIEESLFRDSILHQFRGVKRTVVSMVMDGYNFHEIHRIKNIKTSQVYRIKRELMQDLSWLQNTDAHHRLVEKNGQLLDDIVGIVMNNASLLPLSRFSQSFIYDYDAEAEVKGWKPTALQDKFESIWDTYPKSCTLAPREHLKTATALNYIIKRVFTRTYPLEINYYHLVEESAGEKFRKLQRIIERSPILSTKFDIENARAWSDDNIELSDGTTIKPMSYKEGSVGKHPHIIILDDVIDWHVMYSDLQNQKAVDKFLMDIYPQISKDEPDKRIIFIGTAQRKDDLYHSLPKDFHCETFRAVNEETHEVLSPELFTYEKLMKIKEDMTGKKGVRYFLKEYQNEPFEAMGIIVKPEWIKYYQPSDLDQVVEKRPIKSDGPNIINTKTIDITLRQILKIYQGWDLSVGKDPDKGDYTAGATIGIDDRDKLMIRIYLLDIYRARIDFNQRIEAVKRLAAKWNPLVIGIEDVAFQYDTIQTAKKQILYPIVGIKSITNKVQSFTAELAPYFENGRLLTPPGLTDFETEILSLPVGEHDDQADAVKLAIRAATAPVSRPNVRSL